jgi:DNA-directed RNA polymerase subunit RPC12/RpoP
MIRLSLNNNNERPQFNTGMIASGMTKTFVCTKCKRAFSIEGGNDGSKPVAHGVTCPNCKEPNEVEWPMNMGFTVNPF